MTAGKHRTRPIESSQGLPGRHWPPRHARPVHGPSSTVIFLDAVPASGSNSSWESTSSIARSGCPLSIHLEHRKPVQLAGKMEHETKKRK